MVYLASPRPRRPRRSLLATLAIASLALSACVTEETDPSTEAAVGLPVDAPRIVVQSLGTGPAELIEYHDLDESDSESEDSAPQQELIVEVAEGFAQNLMPADVVEPSAPAGGDVETIRLPLRGSTSPAAEADTENQEREASRDVEFRLGQPSHTNLEFTDDLRSAEGFLLGWRGADNGEVSTVRLAAPLDATDEGRAATEQALMKLLSMPVVFPEEEISQGATWTVDSRVTGQSTLLQTTTFTLVSLEGDTVKLEVDIQQRPALGALEFEGQPGAEDLTGQSLNVLNSNTTSQGELTVDLSQPLPVDGQVAYTTRVVYGGPDSEIRVVQDSTTAVSFGE